MQPMYNNQPVNQQPQAPSGISLSLILKICGVLAVIFLLFLPIAGCKGTNAYNVKGLDMFEGIFKSGKIDASSIFFILSVISGIIIIFFNKPVQFIIGGAAGLITFLAAFFIVRSKPGMDVVQMKIGAYLAILIYAGIAIAALIKAMGANSTKPAYSPTMQPTYPPQPQQPIYPPQTQQPVYPPQPQQPIYPPQPQQPVQPQQTAPKQKFCTKCGNKFPENNTAKFCTKCGAKII
jgi:hypothetical protein